MNINKGLSPIQFERSNCGVGVLVNLNGEKSHQLIVDGFQVLKNLDHRGARGSEEKTGDGAGILLQKPHDFYKSQITGLGDFDSYGVGQLFLPKNENSIREIRKLIESCLKDEGFVAIAWREVPTVNSDLGATALASEPVVMQLFAGPVKSLTPEALDSKLYTLRRVIEKSVEQCDIEDHERFYICSFDRRKVVYKGLLTCDQLPVYYPELSNPSVTSNLVLVHSRFSTNTLGAWRLAHPYRNIVHNGEINTLRGNINWMRARQALLNSDKFGDSIHKIIPVTHEDQSDTAILDNVLELIVESGRSLPHALRLLVPEAWSKDKLMDERRKEWYDFHSTLMEPWDGPALIAFTDGYMVGSILDRNGLRPARYYITTDNRMILSSEAGVLDTQPEQIARTGRLKPGQMLLIDPSKGGIIPDNEVFNRLTDERYGRWLREKRVKLDDIDPKNARYIDFDYDRLIEYQRVFGYTLEDLHRFIMKMAEDAKDPIGAMGNDTPLSVLSNRNKTLFSYFKQQFAQVSNPPIDYLREDLVTSLTSHIGRKQNLLVETAEHCRQLFLDSPILTNHELALIRGIDNNNIRSCTIDVTYPNNQGLRKGIESIRQQVEEAIENGCEIIILSDRNIGPDRTPVPSLLLIGSVHHHLIRKGLRCNVGLILETADPTDVHHFCTLVGYGADAINPYLAYASIKTVVREGRMDIISTDEETALANYKHAVEDGLQKVMSKMGISTLESYKGAQIFEIVGIDHDVVDEFFEGTASRIEGAGLEQIEKDIRDRHYAAYYDHVPGNLELEQEGEYYWRRDGEYHQWNPITLATLQHAARTNDERAYRQFAKNINDQAITLKTIRGLMDFKIDPVESIPIEEVEPATEIVKRFFTGSMSFGSLSKEAHETLAVAMNRIGAKASSGEGGEEVERFGTERECRIKQVASGRFGVTIEYLRSATDIEIKMAQGAKPGEGGQLPGRKVNDIIAKVRYTTPGVELISPPPHHDIYSIEDLAQLIHDLKCANPDADIHVKLVSKAGVGTIAAGVAKAKADTILISGQSGGTGASAKTSIKSAGVPWELGLSEANQVLLTNNLRSRVRLRVDGGLKTGRDAVVAALLGAEEFGFGTAALVVEGCIMLRKCHTNTCSVGVATQDPELRKKFSGQADHVINYMFFMAEEMREYMADLGFRTVEDMVGRVDKLSQRPVDHERAKNVNLAPLLFRPKSSDTPCKSIQQNHELEKQLDYQFIERAQSAIEFKERVEMEYRVTNRDRTIGTILSSVIAGKYGMAGLPDHTIRIKLFGSAGQSLGAFLSNGVTIYLEGDANDYVGKGLSGGKIIVHTPDNAPFGIEEHIILGNVALYGAVKGEAYFNGAAGERFAVRNSGAYAVVEGVGDHACEYMTGGVVTVLGTVGRNFGAGMSGGEAFVFDEDGSLDAYINHEMVHLEAVTGERDIFLLRRIIENHYYYTSSKKAREILDNWNELLPKFAKVMPDPYGTVVNAELERGNDIRIAPPPLPDEAEGNLPEAVETLIRKSNS